MIIAGINQKGGVAKTTTNVTLAAQAAAAGLRVLLIDLDSQGNVADCLGLPGGNELNLLLTPGMGRPLAECVVQARPGLEVIRANKDAVQLKLMLAGVMMREQVLARALDGYPHDLVILDCAPSVDLLQLAAMVAADLLVVPTRLDQLAIKGVKDVLGSLAELRKMRASHAELAGVVPTFYERSTSESAAQLQNLVRVFGGLVLPPVPVDTKVREAARAGQWIGEYDPHARAMVGTMGPHHKVVGGYGAVWDRLRERVL